MVETGDKLTIDSVYDLDVTYSTGHQPPIVVGETDVSIEPSNHRGFDVELLDHVGDGVLIHAVRHVARVKIAAIARGDKANPNMCER
jgi:hypothetical protein